MADHVVDARAAALGEVLVAQAGGGVPVVERELANHVVELPRRHARLHMRADKVEHAGVEPPGAPQHLALLLVQPNDAFAHVHEWDPADELPEVSEKVEHARES